MPASAIAERVYRDLTVRAFEVRAGSWREADRSFEAVLATEAPCLVMDLQRWEPVEEILLMRGCRLPKKGQVPLLDSHNRTSVREGHVGSIRELRMEGDRLLGRCFLSSTEEVIGTKVKEGHVTDISVGYHALASVIIEPGKTAEVEGRSFTAGARPLRVTTEWPVKEGSLCPIGADEDANVREEPAGGLPAQRKEGMEMPENTPAPAGAAVTPPAASAPPEKREAPKPEARELELLRRDVLAITPLGLEKFATGLLVQPGMTVEAARAALLAEFARGKDQPAGSTEPADPKRAGTPAAPKVSEIAGEVLVRSLVG